MLARFLGMPNFLQPKPPQLTPDDPRWPGSDPRYRDLQPEQIPLGESLKDTYNRAVPYFKNNIEPELKIHKNILIVAHGNSLRALMMYLENISPTEIEEINIETGVPRLYEYTETLELLNVHYLNN